MPREVSPTLRTAIYAAWCLAATLLASELGVRLLLPESPALVMPSENERLVYELDPAHPEVGATGLRGEPVPGDPPSDAFVIAAIGDSHTYSVRSETFETSYPAVLERELRGLGRGRVRVLNFGVPGYNAAQELEVFRAKTPPFHPDLVVLQYTENDSHVCNYIRPRHPRWNRLIHRSRLLVHAWRALLYRPGFVNSSSYRFVAQNFPDALLFVEGLVGTAMDPDTAHPSDDPAQVPARYHYMLGRENLEAHVREFGELARRRGVALLATGFIEPEDEALYRDAGFDVLSFFSIFRGLDMEDFGYRMDQTASHLDDSGSAFVARALARHIDAHFFETSRTSAGG